MSSPRRATRTAFRGRLSLRKLEQREKREEEEEKRQKFRYLRKRFNRERKRQLGPGSPSDNISPADPWPLLEKSHIKL